MDQEKIRILLPDTAQIRKALRNLAAHAIDDCANDDEDREMEIAYVAIDAAINHALDPLR